MPPPNCHWVSAQQSTYQGENGLDSYDEDSNEEAMGGMGREWPLLYGEEQDVRWRVNATPATMAPPTPSSSAALQVMSTTTSTKARTMTTITLPVTIKLMGAMVLVPHLARRGFNIVVVVTALSCITCKHADTHTFECHRHAGWGQRADDADSVIIGNSGACGYVQRSRHGADDKILC